MASLKVLTYPDPLLRKPSVEVTDFGKIEQLVNDMLDTVHLDGAALAARQVGASERIFVISSACSSLSGLITECGTVFVNPMIISRSEETDVQEEGCLSFPGLTIPVRRHLRVKVSAQSMHGIEFTVDAEGWTARVMQHEIDHLDGRLFIDHLPMKRRLEIARRMLSR